MSILDNRPSLAHEVEQVAEVAGYLWERAGLNAMVATSL